MIRKVLIPNRGEIAVRIINAAHQLGIKTVVTLSELEKDTLPAQLSDEVYFFQEGPLSENYLNIELIIGIAQSYNADSLHPGYGFLSENFLLAEACHKNDITFIGPSPENIKQMGDKAMARTIAKKASVPLLKSWNGTLQNILSHSEELPYPVLIKAVLGGGGKGMQVCNSRHDLIEIIPQLSIESKRYFGDDRLYVEQYIKDARHIEIQIIADKNGHTIYLPERECTIQRRYQKIIEESPSNSLRPEVRQALFADAVKICKSINYQNVGTIEFLVDSSGQHYFLEMNTRIQVEHCVSEEVTGIDIVKWQFKIADNQVLSIHQNGIKPIGHAIELRICAEDPANNFQPSPGKINQLINTNTSNNRIEIGIDKPSIIHPQFDTMIAKLIVHESTREKATVKAQKVNEQFVLRGIKTNSQLLQNILHHPDYISNKINTQFCDNNIHALLNEGNSIATELVVLAYASLRFNRLSKYWRALPIINFSIGKYPFKAKLNRLSAKTQILINDIAQMVDYLVVSDNTISFKYQDSNYRFFYFEEHDTCEIIYEHKIFKIVAQDKLPAFVENKVETFNNESQIKAPLPSSIVNLPVTNGQKVKKGDVLVVLESMKTENHIKAWKDGIIDKVHVKKGDSIKLNQLIMNYI